MGTDPSKCSASKNVTISLASGVIAGVAAATISQPADGLLSKVNKKGAGGEGPIFTRLGRIAKEVGEKELADLHADCMQKAQDFEMEVKSRAEELKALAEAKKVIKEATGGEGGAEDLTYDLNQEG